MVIKFVGNLWVDKILLLIIIGFMIIVIGLGLVNFVVINVGFVVKGDWCKMLVVVVIFLIVVFINIKGKGFIKIILFLFVIIGGYILLIIFGLVDLFLVEKVVWFELLKFYLLFKIGLFYSYKFYFGLEMFVIFLILIVMIVENIGDYIVLG